ncbi:MAG: nucleotidyltransferase domain-containing protein [Pseudomonadota bacterium]
MSGRNDAAAGEAASRDGASGVDNAIQLAIPLAIRAEIRARLEAIEREEDARILFAIESGSRAWGFPSPDSDYDVRFVYVRPLDQHLTLRERRDVIERPIDADLDISGWDLKKALALLMKPNPVLLEWLSSPIRYRWDDALCARLEALARRVAHGCACRHHYLGLGERNFRRNIADAERPQLKKYFYALRPAMALRWLRMRPEEIPPMKLQALMAGVALAPDLAARLEALVALKGETREMGDGERLADLDAFIKGEFALARAALDAAPPAPEPPWAEAEALFRAVVKGEALS